MSKIQEIQRTDLYKKIDGLVRHHDHSEPYITNTVVRIYSLVSSGLSPEKINSMSDYRRGYSSGYKAGRRATQEKE